MIDHDEDNRDPMLGGALREALGDARLDATAEDALVRRIVAASAFRLAALRRVRPVTWWEQTARWSRFAAPVGAIAAAAGITLAFLVPSAEIPAETPVPLAEAVASAIPGHDALGALGSDTLWSIAVAETGSR